MKKFIFFCVTALGIGVHSQISLPYSESFTSIVAANGLPSGWTRSGNTTRQPTYIANQSSYNRSGYGDTKYIAFNWGSITGNYYFVGPFTLAAGTSYTTSILYKSTGNADIGPLELTLGTSAAAATHTTTIASKSTIPNQAYQKLSGSFTVSTDGSYYIGIKGTTGTTTSSFLVLDDFSVKATPSCVPPSTVSASGITETSATINWTSVANSDLYYSTSTDMPNSSTAPMIENITGSTQTLSSLSPGTIYNVWMRSYCGQEEKSEWTPVYSFTTSCSIAHDVPYTQDFSVVTGGTASLPPCTTIQNVGLGSNWGVYARNVNTTKGQSAITGNALYYYDSQNTFQAANTWFYTSGVSLEAGKKYILKFLRATEGYYTEKLKLAYGLTPNNTDMTNVISDATIYSEENTNEVVEYIIEPENSGVYYIGFNAYSGVGQSYIIIDNISLTEQSSTTLSADNSSKLSYSVYPNPFTDIIRLSDTKGVKSISVNDISGKKIKTLNIATEINLTSLKAGVYILNLVIEDGTVKSIKVIKK